MAAGTLLLFNWELQAGAPLAQAQTVALTTMVFFQIFHLGNSRSEWQSVFQRSPFSNPFLFLATAAAVTVHIAALYAPPMQFVLRVEPIGIDSWLRIIITAASVIVISEIHKLVRKPRRASGVPGRQLVSPTP
jgi:Ca2+-transporting ATPase